MFPVDKFTSVKAELISDSKAPKPRLFRYKSEGGLEPYYKFNLTTPPLTLREGMAVDAVLDSFHGNVSNFDLKNPMPQQKVQEGLYLYEAAPKGANVIIVAGFNPNETEAVIAGDFITINGSRKAYRVCFDADANSSGHATITITQGLIKSYLAPSTIKYGRDVVFQVSMEDRDSAEVSVEKSQYIVHDVELIEQI